MSRFKIAKDKHIRMCFLPFLPLWRSNPNCPRLPSVPTSVSIRSSLRPPRHGVGEVGDDAAAAVGDGAARGDAADAAAAGVPGLAAEGHLDGLGGGWFERMNRT